MVQKERTRGTTMTEEKKGLREELNFISEQLKEKGIIDENKQDLDKKKKFKLAFMSSSWWKAKLGRRHVKRKWIIIFHLKNRSLQIYKKQIVDQTVMIDGIPRIATDDNILLWNGRKPTLIIRDYSVKPISPSDISYMDVSEDAVQQGKKGLNVAGYRILMDRMKNEALKSKKPIPMWIWAIAGLLVAGGIAYLIWGKS